MTLALNILLFQAGWFACVLGWIGWDFRSQYGRLKLIANNSRFLILPDWHRPNIGSRVLSLTERRVVADWQERFGHPLLLLETFVDPRRFHGGVYRAANWIELGLTQGYRRTREGYSAQAGKPRQLTFVSGVVKARHFGNVAELVGQGAMTGV